MPEANCEGETLGEPLALPEMVLVATMEALTKRENDAVPLPHALAQPTSSVTSRRTAPLCWCAWAACWTVTWWCAHKCGWATKRLMRVAA